MAWPCHPTMFLRDYLYLVIMGSLMFNETNSFSFLLNRLFTLVKGALRQTQPDYLISMSDFVRPKKARTLDIVGNLINVVLFDQGFRLVEVELGE